jgi:hypothetical protein
VPNIAPFGLFARNGGAWKGPAAIFARDAGTWKPVQAVWAMQGGTWKLIWARTATSPSSVTIAYVPTQVTVTWVASNPRIADSYNVYRPDGSFVANVANTPLVDPDPRPLVGQYRVVGVLSNVESENPGTVSNSLDLTLQAATFTATLINGGTASQTVNLAWTANALGIPDSWNVYRDTTLLTNVAGNVLAFTDASPAAGVDVGTYRIVPVLTGMEGTARSANIPIAATPPPSVTCAATTVVGQVKISWGTPTGTFTGFEVEQSVDNVTWTAVSTYGTSIRTATVTFSGTSGVRHLRVRTLSLGGSSAWVSCSATPVWDVTPPANANITSWKPETSYGRMVVRFTTSSSSDLNSYLVQQRLAGGTFVNVGSWTAANPSTAYAVVCATRSAGQVAEVRVLLRDDLLNQNSGDTATYTLAASPITVDPSGDKSGTWRDGTSTADWRNDSTRAANEIATGWTSSGHNIGCFIYGTTIDTALGTRTIVSATIEYYRENEGGLSAAVVPLFWTHNKTSRSAGRPVLDDEGVAAGSRDGVGCVRATPNDTGSFALPTAFITALQAGTAKGLAMYRGVVGSGDPDNYYGLFGIGAVSNNGIVNGRLKFTHLG